LNDIVSSCRRRRDGTGYRHVERATQNPVTQVRCRRVGALRIATGDDDARRTVRCKVGRDAATDHAVATRDQDCVIAYEPRSCSIEIGPSALNSRRGIVQEAVDVLSSASQAARAHRLPRLCSAHSAGLD